MKRAIKVITLVGVLSVLSSITYAVPQSVSYVGELSSPSGIPLTGDFTVLVGLYSGESGGTALWNDNLGIVSVDNGRFDVKVCSQSCAGFVATVAGNDVLWLEFVVGGQTLAPRQRVESVPFALRAADAESLGGVAAAAYVTTGNLLDALTGEFAFANTACSGDAVMTGVDAAGQPICDETPFAAQACSDCLQPVVDNQTTMATQLTTMIGWFGEISTDIGDLSANIGAILSDTGAMLSELDTISTSIGSILTTLATQTVQGQFIGNSTNNHGVDTEAVVPNPIGSILERLETLQGSPNLHGATMLQSEFLTLFGRGPVATWSVKINNGELDQSVPNAAYVNMVQGRSPHAICQAIFGTSAFAQVVAAGSSGYESASYTAYVAPVYPVSPIFVIKDAWSHGPAHIGTVIASSCHSYSNDLWSSGQCGNTFADRYLLNGYTGYVSFVLPCTR